MPASRMRRITPEISCASRSLRPATGSSKHDDGLFGDGPRQLRQLAVPIGQILGKGRREMRHAELLEDVEGAGALVGLEASEEPGARSRQPTARLGRRPSWRFSITSEAVDELQVLEGACEPHAGSGMRGQVGYVLAGKSDAAGTGAVQAADAVDECRFTGTVRADQRVHRAALDGKETLLTATTPP